MKPSFLQLVPCAAILSLREKIRGMPVFHATDIALSPQMGRDQKTWAARGSDLFLKNLPCFGRWQRSAVITLRDWEEAVSCPPVSFLSPPSSGGESRTAIKGKGKGLRVLRLFQAPTPTRPFPPCRGETACCFFPPGRSLHFSASSFTGIPAKKKRIPGTRGKGNSFQHGATGERDTFLIIRLPADGAPFSSGNSGTQPPSFKPYHSKSPRFPKTSLSFIFKPFFALSNWTWQANCVMMPPPFFS